MTAGVFYTKKQRVQLRKRRQKKRKALLENVEGNDDQPATAADNSKKRKLPVEQETAPDAATAVAPIEKPTKPQIIIIPADLDAKAAKKLRKDARRKARLEGDPNGDSLRFVLEGQEITSDDQHHHDNEEDKDGERRKKKPKKSFPSINALLQQNKLEQSKQQQDAALLQAQSALPSSYTSRYVAIDCEMVGIGADGKQSALARVSMVDWHGAVLLDTFVQVPSRVTDFRTHVSGVTAKDIQPRASNKDGSNSGGAMDVKVCRDQVAAILKDKVLVGHALHNDLQALLLQHPKEDIRDTAKYRPFQRVAGIKWRPRKLRDLVKQHLGKDIQVAGESHDSIEDASSAMELFKFVREEWEKEIEAKQKKLKKKR